MTTVVTGASGHLGANLIRVLIDRELSPLALVHRDQRALTELDIETRSADVLERSSLVDAFRGAETVYHLAAQVEVAGSTLSHSKAVNVTGTSNVVSACLEAGVGRLVHVSSCQALIQRPVAFPIDDCRRLADARRCSVYDKTKALAERAVLRGVELGLDAVIVRSSAVIGPYDFKPSQLGVVLLFMARGWLPILVKGGHDWVDARDVVDGMIAAAERGRRGEGYLLGGHYSSLMELGTLVSRHVGRMVPLWASPQWIANAGAPLAERIAVALGRRPLWSPEALRILSGNGYISSRKAQHELGYQPRPIEVTVSDTLEWYSSQGMI